MECGKQILFLLDIFFFLVIENFPYFGMEALFVMSLTTWGSQSRDKVETEFSS